MQVEVEEYVMRFREERDRAGHALVVRNGTARPRPVTTGVGPLTIAAPRVNDQRIVAGVRQKFTSAILPPYVRRSPRVESVLPLLYLHGLSSGDFREALPALLGPEAAGLSSSAILRLSPRPGPRSTRPSGAGTWRRATTSISGPTACTSPSAWRRSGCARWS